MSNVRLESGFFTEQPAEKESEAFLEKDALLVYAGIFQSMDGPVEVTADHLNLLATNHNSYLSKFKRLASGDVPAKAFPPIQLDHSASATMTVGRLAGDLRVGETDIDAQTVPALFGKVRILGKENVEKVKDGRWTHLSIGADLETGKLNELTITPFPAAANASLLSRMGRTDWIDPVEEEQAIKVGSVTISTAKSKKDGRWVWVADLNGSTESGHASSRSAAVSAAKAMAKAMSGDEELCASRLAGDHETKEPLPVGTRVEITSGPEKYKTGKITAVKNNGGQVGYEIQGSDGESYFAGHGDVSKLSRLAEGESKVVYSQDEFRIVVKGDKYYFVLLKISKTEHGPYKDIFAAKAAAKEAIEDVGELSRLSKQIYKGHEIETEEVGGGKWKASVNGTDLPEKCESNAAAFRVAKEFLDEMLDGADDDNDNEGFPIRKLSAGDKKEENMDKEKLKKHLMETTKCSAEEADKKLSEMDDEGKAKLAGEVDEAEKKLAAEEADKKEKLAAEEPEKEKLSSEDEEKAEKEKKTLSEEKEEKEKGEKLAAKTSFLKLAKDMRQQLGESKLTARKSALAARLSSLRAGAKMTPAEIKKVDLVELAGKSDEAVESFFQGYELRENVIDVGQHGSSAAETIAKLSKRAGTKELTQETLSNMPFTGAALSKKMAAEEKPKLSASKDFDNLFDEVCKMMDSGKRDDALRKLRELMGGGAADPDTDMAQEMDPQAEKRMTALAGEVKNLQNMFEDLIKQVGPVLGVDASELEQ